MHHVFAFFLKYICVWCGCLVCSLMLVRGFQHVFVQFFLFTEHSLETRASVSKRKLHGDSLAKLKRVEMIFSHIKKLEHDV